MTALTDLSRLLHLHAVGCIPDAAANADEDAAQHLRSADRLIAAGVVYDETALAEAGAIAFQRGMAEHGRRIHGRSRTETPDPVAARIADAFPERWWTWSVWDLAERIAATVPPGRTDREIAAVLRELATEVDAIATRLAPVQETER